MGDELYKTQGETAMPYNMFAVVAFASIRTWDSLSVKQNRDWMCIPYSCNEVYDQWLQYTPRIWGELVAHPSTSLFLKRPTLPVEPKTLNSSQSCPGMRFRSIINILNIWFIRIVICKTYNDVPLGHDPFNSIKNILWTFPFKKSSTFLRLRSTGICRRRSLLSTSLRRWWGCGLAWACFRRYRKYRGCGLARNWQLFSPRYTCLFRRRGLWHFSWELRGSSSPGRALWVGTGSLRRARRNHGWVCLLAHWHLRLVRWGNDDLAAFSLAENHFWQ